MTRRRRRRGKSEGVAATPQGQPTPRPPQSQKPPQPSRQPAPGRQRRDQPRPKSPPPRRPIQETFEEKVENLLKNFPPDIGRLQEYLKTCRVIHDALEKGSLEKPSPEELFYLTASGVETVAEDRVDRLYDSEFRIRLDEMRKAAGLGENEYWKAGDPAIPEEYQECLNAFKAKKREILASLFRENERPDMAELVVEDYPAYLERKLEGRQRLRDRDPLDPFVGRILSQASQEEQREVDPEAR